MESISAWRDSICSFRAMIWLSWVVVKFVMFMGEVLMLMGFGVNQEDGAFVATDSRVAIVRLPEISFFRVVGI